MARFSKNLLQPLYQLHSHHFLPAVVIGLHHHRFKRVCPPVAKDTFLGVGLHCVLPFIFKRVVQEVRRSAADGKIHDSLFVLN